MSHPLPPPPPPASSTTTCYRHPNREAGRRCTRCGKWACTECLVQADVGSQCVECFRQGRPAAATRVRYWSASKPALVTYILMAINVAVFVWMGAKDPDNLSGRRITQENVDLGLIKAYGNRFGQLAGGVADGEWYRLVTSGFLHFGIFHIAFNMLLLYQLGNMLEPTIGRVKFTLLYFASLLGGAAGVLLLSPNELTGGASGAVFGLLGAAAVAQYQRGVNPLSTGIGTTIMLNVLITFTLPNISIGGHLGGLVAGAAAGWFVTAPKSRRIPVALAYGAPIAVAAIAVAVSYVAGHSV